MSEAPGPSMRSLLFLPSFFFFHLQLVTEEACYLVFIGQLVKSDRNAIERCGRSSSKKLVNLITNKYKGYIPIALY